MLIVLIAKLDGGVRPIGLPPTIIRVWMRAEACNARACEAQHASKSLCGSTCRGAQRAAWVEAFNAEAAFLGKVEQAQALVDLT